jgi:adenosine deaminase
LARLREAGVGIEIHAGEWAGPESVWDALENGFPNRIGHGVALFQDPRLVERFQRDRIHVEMCLTSNVKTGSVERIENHPVRQARELSLSFSVSTDDPGPFACSMESEYELLAGQFGFQEHDFEVMTENALNARFQPQLRYAVHG